MSEKEIKETIISYVLDGLNVEDISTVEVNSGICWIEMNNKDIWFVDVEKAIEESESQ